MLAAEAISTAAGIWGLLGVIATGFFGWLIAKANKKSASKEDPPLKTIETAADAASSTILEFIEENVLVPLREDIKGLRSSRDRLQVELEHARATIAELRQRLSDAEHQILVLRSYLDGGRHRD